MIADKQLEPRGMENPRAAVRRARALTLSHCLSEDPASLEEIIPRLVQVIQAVEEAHDRKKEHRYLGPEKIRFTEDGSVQMPVSSARGGVETVALGSLKYMAPESLEQSEGVDNCRLRDCYVLGFIFYEILLGRKLFESQFRDISTQGEVGWLTWHADKTKTTVALTKLIDRFPQSVSGLITEMTAKDLAARTKDLNLVAQTLASTLELTRVNRDPAANPDPRSFPVGPQYVSRANKCWGSVWISHAVKSTWKGIAMAGRRVLRGGATLLLLPVSRLANAIARYAEPCSNEARPNGGGVCAAETSRIGAKNGSFNE